MTAAADQAEELAKRLLLLSALAGRVAEAKSATKDELAQLMKPGTLLRPQIDGASAGSVSMTTGRSRAEIYDDTLFLGWVRAHHPEFVSLRPVVDDTFRADCLVVSEKAGQPVSPYGDVDVAGIRATRGEPTLSARPDKNRAADLWAAIRSTPLLDELEGETA